MNEGERERRGIKKKDTKKREMKMPQTRLTHSPCIVIKMGKEEEKRERREQEDDEGTEFRGKRKGQEESLMDSCESLIPYERKIEKTKKREG